MSLIKSISGIRGTIGGQPGTALTPHDIVSFASAYGAWLTEQASPINERYKLVIGRDARISGELVQSLVCSTLQALGIDIIDAGLATTPTVEMAVCMAQADGGIILTASHNPKQWNALKLLNSKGEFLSAQDGERLLELTTASKQVFADVDSLGTISKRDFLQEHIQSILALPLVNRVQIEERKYKIAVDAVNSVGGIAVPAMLEALGVYDIVLLNCEPNGHFAHNPEPLPENLVDIQQKVIESGADLGIVVDPDVDRLALICSDGSFFGEEYTLVAVADYILQHHKGPTVSNLSSSRALRDVSKQHACFYEAAAVGEVNVVEKMKAIGAVIGGEGNGGIIYPELHYGRDALVGLALFLSMMAKEDQTALEIRAAYPSYFMSKNKIQLAEGQEPDVVLNAIFQKYQDQNPINIDGVKIDFDESWVHLRKSNTEPIVRIYTEARTREEADQLAQRFLEELASLS